MWNDRIARTNRALWSKKCFKILHYRPIRHKTRERKISSSTLLTPRFSLRKLIRLFLFPTLIEFMRAAGKLLSLFWSGRFSRVAMVGINRLWV
jgi:hypothetical protein